MKEGTEIIKSNGLFSNVSFFFFFNFLTFDWGQGISAAQTKLWKILPSACFYLYFLFLFFVCLFVLCFFFFENKSRQPNFSQDNDVSTLRKLWPMNHLLKHGVTHISPRELGWVGEFTFIVFCSQNTQLCPTAILLYNNQAVSKAEVRSTN